jgi:hypothetical protein
MRFNADAFTLGSTGPLRKAAPHSTEGPGLPMW